MLPINMVYAFAAGIGIDPDFFKPSSSQNTNLASNKESCPAPPHPHIQSCAGCSWGFNITSDPPNIFRLFTRWLLIGLTKSIKLDFDIKYTSGIHISTLLFNIYTYHVCQRYYEICCHIGYPGLILGMCPANVRRCYFVTTSLIGCVQA